MLDTENALQGTTYLSRQTFPFRVEELYCLHIQGAQKSSNRTSFCILSNKGISFSLFLETSGGTNAPQNHHFVQFTTCFFKNFCRTL